MRYGIFSDTHANLEALEAVLRQFDKHGVDELVCIGDTVGYGAQPNPCCDKVRTLTKHTILGNHDAAVAGRMDYSYYYDAAREALDHHATTLTDENMKWLRKLRYRETDGDVHFCHGSPLDLEQFEYIFTIEGTGEQFVLGVQWHPEYLPCLRSQRRLFAALVRAAREQAAQVKDPAGRCR